MSEDFRQRFKQFGERCVGFAPRCNNEESTKLFLVLPFLNFLEYDDRNPDEVCPEYSADFSEKYKNRVDFVILKNAKPVIAVECKGIGMPLKDDRGQLRSYFNAVATVKMGVLTDGLIYEFYADSDEPNMMDAKSFLPFDLREIARGKIEDSVDEGLRSLTKTVFSPENIGTEAKRKLIFQNFVHQISNLAEAPSEPFVRMLLSNANISHIRTQALAGYTELARGAFRDFVNLRILKRLDLPTKEETETVLTPESVVPPIEKADNGIITTNLEMEVFHWTKRRLSFLIKDKSVFNEVQSVEYRDYKGKFVVFYKKERAGRLFDFYENRAKKFTFDFGSLGGEVSADALIEIDQLLLDVFTRRINEMRTQSKQS